MKLEDILLKSMRHRDKHARYAPVMKSPLLQEAFLPHKTIDAFGRWFRENPEAEVIDYDAFLTWAKLAHLCDNIVDELNLKEDLDRSNGEIPEHIEAGLMDRLTMEIRSLELEKLVKDYRSGKSMDLYSELRGQIDLMDKDLTRKRGLSAVSVSIEEMLQRERNEEGLKWRLSCLNKCMRPLRPGDFIVVAARPDAGKTSFLASELTFMAGQLPEGRPILWLNNEGPGDRIVWRTWQAALGASASDLEYIASQNLLHTMYSSAIGGENQIKVYDVHDLLSHEIEDLIKEVNPALVVFDMVDNIRFSGTNHLGGQRTDQLLETMYQWARVLGVKYNCVVMATSQVSADGEGNSYPTMAMLKDSKTGKQGAADTILIIGKDNNLDDVRFLSTPKNKLARQGAKDPHCPVHFDQYRSRFYDNEDQVVKTIKLPTTPVQNMEVHHGDDIDPEFPFL